MEPSNSKAVGVCGRDSPAPFPLHHLASLPPTRPLLSLTKAKHGLHQPPRCWVGPIVGGCLPRPKGGTSLELPPSPSPALQRLELDRMAAACLFKNSNVHPAKPPPRALARFLFPGPRPLSNEFIKCIQPPCLISKRCTHVNARQALDPLPPSPDPLKSLPSCRNTTPKPRIINPFPRRLV